MKETTTPNPRVCRYCNGDCPVDDGNACDSHLERPTCPYCGHNCPATPREVCDEFRRDPDGLVKEYHHVQFTLTLPRYALDSVTLEELEESIRRGLYPFDPWQPVQDEPAWWAMLSDRSDKEDVDASTMDESKQPS